MPAHGDSASVTALRAAVARIEAGGPRPGGERRPLGARTLDAALGGGLRRGTLCEIAPAAAGDIAAACGFALALAARLMFLGEARHLVWILEEMALMEAGWPYAPGLAALGIDPARLVLAHAPRPQDAMHAFEEALKTRGAVVIGELWGAGRAMDFTLSRRLALAARAGSTIGLMVQAGAAGRADGLTGAAEARLEVAAAASAHEASAGGRMPIPGPPIWSVRVLKARAGPRALAGFDRERRHLLAFDAEKGCFHDALPIPQPALPQHRSGGAADAPLRRALGA